MYSKNRLRCSNCALNGQGKKLLRSWSSWQVKKDIWRPNLRYYQSKLAMFSKCETKSFIGHSAFFSFFFGLDAVGVFMSRFWLDLRSISPFGREIQILYTIMRNGWLENKEKCLTNQLLSIVCDRKDCFPSNFMIEGAWGRLSRSLRSWSQWRSSSTVVMNSGAILHPGRSTSARLSREKLQVRGTGRSGAW